MNTLASTSDRDTAKFIRRSDVTPYLRLFIAFTALQAQREHTWGVITALARTYHISRTFVYLLAAALAVTCDERCLARRCRRSSLVTCGCPTGICCRFAWKDDAVSVRFRRS